MDVRVRGPRIELPSPRARLYGQVSSFLISLLVLWLLLALEQHSSLLRAMLPGKVIRQLQVGQHLSRVTC